MRRQTLWGLAAPAVVGVVAACAGGPGVKGPEAVALFQGYSGTWVLDTASSERVPEPGLGGRERGRGGGGGGARGGDPFGGGRPGVPGGDPFGGGRPGVPGGDPFGGGRGEPRPDTGGRGGFRGRDEEAMRASMDLARSRPQRIELELSDSLFVIRETPGTRVALPMKGDEVELALAGWPGKMKLKWDNRRPSVERAPKDGTSVVDHYELAAPDRLLVTREFEMPTRGKVQVRFAYDRKKTE
jgi:hypothetical protein